MEESSIENVNMFINKWYFDGFHDSSYIPDTKSEESGIAIKLERLH